MKDTKTLIIIIAAIFVINTITNWTTVGKVALGLAGALLLIASVQKLRRYL